MRFFLFLAILFAGMSSNGQVLLTDDFNYATGQLLTANGWTVLSGGTTQAIDATTGLSFSGYGGAVAGGAANLDNDGQDVNKAFTSQTSGVVYVSSVIQITASTTAGYFMGLSSSLGNTTYFSRLWVNAAGNGINVGTNAPSSYVAITPGVPTLVVLKFDLATKVTSLFVLNSFVSSEPTTPSSTFTEAANTNAAGAVFLRQYSSAQRIIVDGIRIANTWIEAALPAGPLVTTTAATSVTTTSARLNSSVNGYGTTTSWSFDYGTTASYGSTATGTPSSGTAAATPYADLSSLVPATFYNFRAVGTVSSTVTNGSNLTFYTLAAVPNAPVVNNAGIFTLDVSIPSGTANGNSGAAEYAIQETGGQYVQANGSLGATAVWQTASAWSTVTVTGLNSNTTYTFHVKARNGAATETAFGASASGTTMAQTSPNITLVTDITAFGNVCTAATSTHNFAISGANLNGAAVTVNALSGYSYSLTETGTYTSTLGIPYTGNSFTNTTVWVKFSPVAVQSYSGDISISGGGLPSSFLVGVTGAGVNTAATVNTTAASAATSTGATLNGNFTAACTAVTSYGFEYSTTNGFANGAGTNAGSSNAASGVFSTSLTTLAPNTTYYYKAYAIDGSGTHYATQQQSFLTSAIQTPVATAATSPTTSSFVANWNVTGGATSYRLDVATDSSFSTGFSGSLAEWTFPTTSGPDTPSTATTLNTSKQITTNAGTIVYSSAGVTTQSASTSGWTSGSGSKYWQVEVNTTGVSNIHLNSVQQSSNTGPKDFKLQYKLGASGTYTDVPGGEITVANNVVTGSADVTLPAACNNQASVFIQWIMTSNTAVGGAAVAGTGTSRIDDIIITASSPTTLLPSYTNLTVNGTSQTVSGLSASTNYYYRVRAVSANSTSGNSNTITATTTAAPVATFGGITQAAGVCAGGTATFNVTGLLYPSTTLLTYHIGTGGNQTASLTPDSSGNASFTLALTAGNNGQTLTVTSVQRTDVTSSSVTVSSNNTVVLVSPASVTYYADADGDTFGNTAVSQSSCTGAPAGYVTDNTDCNDADNTKHASFPFYADTDGDTFGAGSSVSVCAVDA
ncbi:beta strand repeat-containing protein, partial [Flavobacterium silvaticum]